jgi:hypothetical protein
LQQGATRRERSPRRFAQIKETRGHGGCATLAHPTLRLVFHARAAGAFWWNAPSDVNDPVAKGDGDRVRPVGGAEFSHRGLDVLVDGSLGDTENFPDLPGGLALRHQCQNFTFTRRE